jgi:hypothetical protein
MRHCKCRKRIRRHCECEARGNPENTVNWMATLLTFARHDGGFFTNFQ